MHELKLTPAGQPRRLDEIPPGLFLFNGTLCMKTEYNLDCYIVASGESFWGGTSNIKELARLMVQPLAVAAIAGA